MDPNANLQEQLDLAREIIALSDKQNDEPMPLANVRLEANAVRLAELVIALDEWIAKGGFVPSRWEAGA